MKAALAALAMIAAPVPAVPPPAAPASPCAGAAEERAALEAEKAELGRTITAIAMGRPVKKKKTSGGDVARGVAGTAASILLPFPFGMAVSAAGNAAAKAAKKGKAPEPGPNVEAMIAREHEITGRLEALEACR